MYKLIMVVMLTAYQTPFEAKKHFPTKDSCEAQGQADKARIMEANKLSSGVVWYVCEIIE